MAWRSVALSCFVLLTGVLAPAARADLVHLPQGTLTLPASLGERTVSGLAGDAEGNVYAGARGSDGSFVVVFDSQGKEVRSFSVGSISANFGRDGGESSDEIDLAIGPDGLLYVGQPVTNLGAPQDRYISVYTTTGTLVRELKPAEGTLWIADLEVDASGIYALVRHAGAGFVRGDDTDEVLRIDPAAGTVSARFALTREETAGFESELGGLALTPDGSIWVTTPLEGSRLIHFAADGSRLSAPPLDTIVDLDSRHVGEADFANGLLYIAAGKPNGMVVITPQGRLVDRVPGEARQLAPAGGTVYATKLGDAASEAARAAQSPEDKIAKLLGAEARPPDTKSGVESRGSCPGIASSWADTLVHVRYPSRGTCGLTYFNFSSPKCSDGSSALQPINIYVGGRGFGLDPINEVAKPPGTIFYLTREQVGDGGNVIVQWSCQSPSPGVVESVYEVKGAIDLIDPSGNVVDRKTGKPVEFATVRLEYTPVRGGSFGTPSLSLMRPQVNPQVTGPDGAFAWDVAAGFWRLRVRAFGYKPFTTAAFEIPPEVTGLVLRLRPSRAARRLIDPAGRVGPVRVGARLRKRVAGLRIRVRRKRVREIVVRRRSFRTAAGIRLRSRELEVLRAYPAAKQSGRVRNGKKVLRYKRAFFTVRGGRVVAIRLARR